MPFSRFTKMPHEKRERLLTVAAQEFAAHGFEAASLNRILEEAQIGKSSAYYYFEDKADLFRTAVEYCLDQLQFAPPSDTFSSLTIETFWPTIAQTYHQTLLQAQARPWLFGAVRAAEQVTTEALQRASLAELTRSLERYITGNIGAMMKRGQELGLIRTDIPDELLITWFRAIDGATDTWLLAHMDHLDQETITHILRQTLASIRRMLAFPGMQSSVS